MRRVRYVLAEPTDELREAVIDALNGVLPNSSGPPLNDRIIGKAADAALVAAFSTTNPREAGR